MELRFLVDMDNPWEVVLANVALAARDKRWEKELIRAAFLGQNTGGIQYPLCQVCDGEGLNRMLNNRQIQSLHRALLSAFNSQELEELIEVGIGAPLRLLVAPGTDARSQVFEIITAAERAGWTADLVQAAYKARPQNRPLAEIYESLGFATPIQLQTGEKEDFATVSSTDEQLKQVVAGSGPLDLDL